MAYLAIDFGGTRTRAAWFDDRMILTNRQEMLSHVDESVEDVIQRIIDIARSVIPPDTVPDAIGIAAPGPLNPHDGIILHAKTLPGWKDVPLAGRIGSALGGVPTFMRNDANLAALAESYFGVAKNADPMIYLTISTGIGGGAVIGGSLFTGWRGMAIEPGHIRFRKPDGRICRLEELSSGTALAQIAYERLKTDLSIQSALRDVAVLDGKAVGDAALAGDAFAREIVHEAAEWLGLGIVNLVHMFNPQAVVLGGSVMDLGELMLAPIREVLQKETLSPMFNDPYLIRTAALGDDVCLYGAAYYARTHARWHRKPE